MKQNPSSIRVCCAVIAAALTVASSTEATLFTKADNSDALNLATSWVNNAVPGASDIAQWDGTVTVNNTTNALGANASWGGLKILNPAGAVLVTTGSVLTVGSSGIDLSAASQNLTLSNAVTLGAIQNWAVGSGRTLRLAGGFTRATGGAFRMYLPDNTANGFFPQSVVNSNLIMAASVPIGTLNDTDYVAATSLQTLGEQVVGGASLGIYTANPATSTPTLANGTYTCIDFTNMAAGDYGLRANSGSQYIYGMRFNQNNTNSFNYWQIDTAGSGRTLTPNSILITTNVGAQNVQVVGAGNIRFGSTAGYECTIFQNNTAGSLVFKQSAPGNVYGNGAASLDKYGLGTVEFQCPLNRQRPFGFTKARFW